MNQPQRSRLETADRASLATYQINRLRIGLGRMLPSNRFYQSRLAGFDPSSLTTLDAIRALPFTTKAELIADQAEHGPYGTNLTYPLRDYVRLHQTSGTTGQP